jgi:hypothetical protein
VAAAFAPGAIVADVARRAAFVPDVSVAPGDPIRSNGGGFYEVVVAAVDD